MTPLLLAYIITTWACTCLCYSPRIFQALDEDLPPDPIYQWRTRKDQRNEGLEAYLREMISLHSPSQLRFRPQPHQHHQQPWPQDLQALGLHQIAASSDFAVPPSDGRFFDPPPRLLPSHLYRDSSSSRGGEERSYPQLGGPADGGTAPEGGEGEAEGEGELSTEGPPPQAVGLSEQVITSEEVVKTPLIDFAAAQENIVLIAIIAGSSTAAVVGVALLIYGFLRFQKKAKDAADVEYPAYGVTGPNKESTPTGDRRLAHSAQMYHYQLTKQQIIAMESSGRGERRGSVSEPDSEDDEENEEGDYTVYECPGLATTGEMEVKNPLFQDETTPANGDQPKE